MFARSGLSCSLFVVLVVTAWPAAAASRYDHPALQHHRIVFRADAREIARHRVARRASPGPVEIRRARLGIADEDIGLVEAAAGCRGHARVQERRDVGDLLSRQRKLRHVLLGPSDREKLAEPGAALIVEHDGRQQEIGAALRAAACIGAVTEGAMLHEGLLAARRVLSERDTQKSEQESERAHVFLRRASVPRIGPAHQSVDHRSLAAYTY
jgi:hypothetical protein